MADTPIHRDPVMLRRFLQASAVTLMFGISHGASANSFRDPFIDISCQGWTAGITAFLLFDYVGDVHITVDAGDGRAPVLIDTQVLGNGVGNTLVDVVETGTWDPGLLGTNTATVRFVLDLPTNTGPFDVTLAETLTCTAGVDIRKQEEGPDSRDAQSGDDIEFEIAVTNVGDQTLTGVEVSDPLAPECDAVLDDLAPGATTTYTCAMFDIDADFTNQACVVASVGAVVVNDCDDSSVTVEQPVNLQGCTPGYWKQSHHFDDWVAYAPGDDFESIFMVDATRSGSLLRALKRGGGSEIALGRHAVAALLNSVNSNVAYAFTAAEVIDLVQIAYTDGSFNEVKNLLESENERGCPLNNSGRPKQHRGKIRSKWKHGGHKKWGYDH